MNARAYHHGNLRHALLDAARSQLRTGGVESLSLRELARQVGVSPAAPYRHFADRQALLAALAAQGLTDLAASIRERRSGGREAVVTAYLAFARRETALYRLMLSPDSSPDELVREALQDLFAELLDGLGDQQADPEQSIRVTAAFWSTLHGSALFELDGTLAWLDGWLRPDPADAANVVNAAMVGSPPAAEES